MAFLAEDRSFGFLDLALPKVHVSPSLHPQLLSPSNGQNTRRVCAPQVEEEAGGNPVPPSPQEGSELGFPSSGGISAP